MSQINIVLSRPMETFWESFTFIKFCFFLDYQKNSKLSLTVKIFILYWNNNYLKYF